MAAKQKETMYLELDGKINIVTKRGRVTKREEIDGKTCLKAILHILEQGLAKYQEK